MQRTKNGTTEDSPKRVQLAAAVGRGLLLCLLLVMVTVIRFQPRSFVPKEHLIQQLERMWCLLPSPSSHCWDSVRTSARISILPESFLLLASVRISQMVQNKAFWTSSEGTYAEDDFSTSRKFRCLHSRKVADTAILVRIL